MIRKYFSVIFFTIIVACSPVKKYQDFPAVTAWEKDIAKFEEAYYAHYGAYSGMGF